MSTGSIFITQYALMIYQTSVFGILATRKCALVFIFSASWTFVIALSQLKYCDLQLHALVTYMYVVCFL